MEGILDVLQILRAGKQEYTSIKVDSSDLVWDTDRNTFFSNYAPVNHNNVDALRGGQQLTTNISLNEHFMAWMRPSAHPSAFIQLMCLYSKACLF
jgi:hypothetical protein